jgi:hypothetical protein
MSPASGCSAFAFALFLILHLASGQVNLDGSAESLLQLQQYWQAKNAEVHHRRKLGSSTQPNFLVSPKCMHVLPVAVSLPLGTCKCTN